MKKKNLIGLLAGIMVSLTACIGSMEDRPSNDIEAFYKCRLNASKGSCEKDNLLWLLALRAPSSGSDASEEETTEEAFVPTPLTTATGLVGADTRSLAITKDSDNNFYVTGHTTGNLDGETRIGSQSLFVIKFNRSGEKQWTKLFGHTEHESSRMWGQDIAVDSSNNIYVAGFSNEGSNDTSNQAILLKLDSNGNQTWKRNSGSGDAGTAEGYGLTLDSAGNIYLTGFTNESLDSQTKTGNDDLFVIKYDSSGTKQWTRLRGVVARITTGTKIASDNSGNIYITGRTTGNLDSITKTANQTMILLKYNSDGVWQWTRNNGVDLASEWVNSGRGVKVDSSGNVYISGDAQNDTSEKYRILVAKYNADGAVQKTEIIQTTADDNQNRISTDSNLALDSSGNLFLAGTITGSLNAEVVGDGHYVLQLDSELANAKYKIIKNEARRETNGVALDGDNNVWTIVNSNDGFDGENKIGGTNPEFGAPTYDMFLTNKLKP